MSNNASSRDIQQVLGLDKHSNASKRRWVFAIVAFIVAASLIAYFTTRNSQKALVQYKTAQVEKGNLTVRVSATGVLRPVNQVDVGTEVSGTIKVVEVDFNDRVKKGQVLARLDTEQLTARLRQTEAALELAQAKVQDAQASFAEAKSRLFRSQELAKQSLASKEDLETASAVYARAEAQIASTKAQVTQVRAQLDADRTTLAKAEIRSPIDGIVLKRQIEPGQTVAASLQTPVLFTLAENLAQMELLVAVDEADVGQVTAKQAATFTVDAYPNRTFPATISQVRFAPETVEGVVTYGTVLTVDNSDLLLRPGMTATADIVVKELTDVVLVSNAALRFTPASPNAKERQSRGLVESLMSRRPPDSDTQKKKEMGEKGKAPRQKIWTLVNGEPQAITVVTGATDGQMTEIVKGDAAPGTLVIIDTVVTRPVK